MNTVNANSVQIIKWLKLYAYNIYLHMCRYVHILNLEKERVVVRVEKKPSITGCDFKERSKPGVGRITKSREGGCLIQKSALAYV